MPDAKAHRDEPLENVLQRQLLQDWKRHNLILFDRAMRAPLIELRELSATLGQWRSGERTLVISREAALQRPWGQVVEILKHEMAHQFVDEVLQTIEPPHGPMFQTVCELRGIDAAATGVSEGGDRPEDRAIARVRKLLSLAQSSNLHEAEAAAAAAQRLMLKFNLGVAAMQATANDYGAIWVGTPKARIQANDRALGYVLTQHFFVEGIWVTSFDVKRRAPGKVLELCGRRENLQMAEYVHAFLSATTERLWLEHARAQGIRSNRERRSFITGALYGFSEKLACETVNAAGEGLILLEDARAVRLQALRHPCTRTLRQSTLGSAQGYAAGASAGRSIVLSRPMTSSAADTSGPRALREGR